MINKSLSDITLGILLGVCICLFVVFVPTVDKKSVLLFNQSADIVSVEIISPIANLHLLPCMEYAQKETGIPVGLLDAMITVESNGDTSAISWAGAIGPMQLMPGTASDMGVNPHNSCDNVLGGAKYMKHLLSLFQGDTLLALTAYNVGPGRVIDLNYETVYANLVYKNWREI